MYIITILLKHHQDIFGNNFQLKTNTIFTTKIKNPNMSLRVGSCFLPTILYAMF